MLLLSDGGKLPAVGFSKGGMVVAGTKDLAIEGVETRPGCRVKFREGGLLQFCNNQPLPLDPTTGMNTTLKTPKPLPS